MAEFLGTRLLPKNDIDLLTYVRILNRRVYLEGDTDEDNNIVAADIDVLADINSKPINLYITSGGGAVYGGQKMIRAIRRAQSKGCEVRGIVRGHAQSMAFLLLQTCDVRVMGAGDVLMAHGIVDTLFNADKRNKEAEDKMTDYLIRHFTNQVIARVVSVRPDSPAATREFWAPIEIDKLPRYYTADEALELGLIDVVHGS